MLFTFLAAAAKSNTTRVIKKTEFDATSQECTYALQYQPVSLDKDDEIEFERKKTISNQWKFFKYQLV